jgi:hypothetical protein
LTSLRGFAADILGETPGKLPPGRSIYRLSGQVTVNGAQAALSTRIGPTDTIATGKGSEIIFAVADNAYILRESSTLSLAPQAEGNVLSIDDAFAGGVCRCQHCGTIQTVPKRAKTGAAQRQIYSKPQEKKVSTGLDELANVVASSGLSEAIRNGAPAPRSASRWPLFAALGILALMIAAVAWLYLGNHEPTSPSPTAAAVRPSQPVTPAPAAPEDAPTAAPTNEPSFCGVTLHSNTIVYVLDRGNATRDSIPSHLLVGRDVTPACVQRAVWLAEQGWRVTAVDFSGVALRMARSLEAERRVAVEHTRQRGRDRIDAGGKETVGAAEHGIGIVDDAGHPEHPCGNQGRQRRITDRRPGNRFRFAYYERKRNEEFAVR